MQFGPSAASRKLTVHVPNTDLRIQSTSDRTSQHHFPLSKILPIATHQTSCPSPTSAQTTHTAMVNLRNITWPPVSNKTKTHQNRSVGSPGTRHAAPQQKLYLYLVFTLHSLPCLIMEEYR